jgi:hypothetical protein
MIHEAAESLAGHAIAKALLIEAGWLVMMATCYPNGMTQDQQIQLVDSIMGMLDPGPEMTDADLERLELIRGALTLYLLLYSRALASTATS